MLQKNDITSRTWKVYSYLAQRSRIENNVILYERKRFSNDLGLKAKQIHQSLEELQGKKVIVRQHTKGSCVWQLVEPVQSDVSDVVLLEEDEVLLTYIHQKQPLKYQVSQISKGLGWSEKQIREVVQRLMGANIVEKRGVSQKGDCLFVSKMVDKNLEKTNLESELLSEMKPIIYLVDTENISSDENYQRLSRLKKGDCVLLFLSQNSLWFNHPKKLDLILNAKTCLPEVKTYYTEVEGKNSLDFIISAKLGCLLTENPKQPICIISKDQGFDGVINQLTKDFNLPNGQLCRKEKF